MKEYKTVSVIIPTFNRCRDVVMCVESVLSSEYPDFEIIVVDNSSMDNTISVLRDKYENRINLISSNSNLGASGGRNLGAKYAKGDYLLFVDSDNVVDKKMIYYLVDFLERTPICGMVGPLMLVKKDPTIIWLYFANINMYTSQATYKGTGERIDKEFSEVVEVGHLPNCFMVRKDDFYLLNGFDEKYFIMYEEADLAERIKKFFKKKIFIDSKAIIYHNIPWPNGSSMSFRSEERSYLTSRNRVYFMKKNATRIQFVVFLVIFLPLLSIYYEYHLLKLRKYKMAYSYFLGIIYGLLL